MCGGGARALQCTGYVVFLSFFASAPRIELTRFSILFCVAVLDDTGSALRNVPSHIQVVHPQDHPLFDTLVEKYCVQRGLKTNIELQHAKDSVTYATDRLDASSCLYFGNLLIRHTQECDGSVAGAAHSSGNTVACAIKTIGLAHNVSTLSSFFIMAFPDQGPMQGATHIFSDCAVVVAPTSAQLAEIAMHAARNAERFLHNESPRIALLSFSSKGSSAAAEAQTVQQALDLIHANAEENGVHDRGFVYDGELQLDAAILPQVAESKAPQSPLGGQANVLIFPNLGAGNIGYKMAERMAGAVAVGPILQGLESPANDLSRGCSTEDILDVMAVTALQV